jgi:hypothetical protein
MAVSSQQSIVLLLLVAAHAILNLFLNPIGASVDDVSGRLALPLMGAGIAQPVLIAIWAALGPGAAAVRIPLSLAAAGIVFLASVPKLWNVFDNDVMASKRTGESLLMELSLFAVVLVLMLVVRRISGWRIQSHAVANDNKAGGSQFSLKYLLALTAVCAALLVLGRSVAAGSFWTESTFWREFFTGLFLFGGTILLALFPMLIIPLLAIARRPSLLAVAALPFLWAGLTWLAVEILASATGESCADLARQLGLLQAGAAVAGLVSALVLRSAGFRLVSSRAQDVT